MSRDGCRYCRHEGPAYDRVMDEDGHALLVRRAEPLPYDVYPSYGEIEPEPKIWFGGIPYGNVPNVRDDGMPTLTITASDDCGDDVDIDIPIRFCPRCGRKLPRCGEARYWKDFDRNGVA